MSGFLHYLQLASHELATIGKNVTKNEIPKTIKKITRCIRNGVDKSQFVNDFCVSYRSKHMQAIERQLQLHLNRIEDWADNNGFKFSQSKTGCVHFC